MYSTIYIYETDFQKSIINYLIERDYFNNEHYLIIDATGHEIKIGNKIFGINFNKIDKLFSSIIELKSLKRQKITCDTLVSTHITGVNSLFLSSFFESNQKILIDDGIGTPVLIQNQSLFKKKIRYQARFILSKILLIIRGSKLNNVASNFKTIDSYYTVYPNIPKKPHHFSIFYIEGFYNRDYRIISGKTGFIGAPLLEFNLTTVKNYKNLLRKVHEEYGDFTYYLHPDEKYAKSLNLPGIEFKKNNEGLEEHFYKTGMPSNVIGFASSALINLALSKNFKSDVEFKFIKKKVYGAKEDQLYYDLLASCKINCSGISL